MTLGALTNKVAAWINSQSSELVYDTDQSRIVDALEESRLFAERTFEWRQNQEVAFVTISPTDGGKLSEAVNADDESVSVKAVHSAWLVDENKSRVHPLQIQSDKGEYLRETIKARTTRRDLMYPAGDLPVARVALFGHSSRVRLIISGDRVYFSGWQPAEDVVVSMNVSIWMPTYLGADADYTDWMLTHGHDYLFWAAIVSLNYFTKDFVTRQEGNLSPPEQKAERALSSLREWDTHSVGYSTIGK